VYAIVYTSKNIIQKKLNNSLYRMFRVYTSSLNRLWIIIYRDYTGNIIIGYVIPTFKFYMMVPIYPLVFKWRQTEPVPNPPRNLYFFYY